MFNRASFYKVYNALEKDKFSSDSGSIKEILKEGFIVKSEKYGHNYSGVHYSEKEFIYTGEGLAEVNYSSPDGINSWNIDLTFLFPLMSNKPNTLKKLEGILGDTPIEQIMLNCK